MSSGAGTQQLLIAVMIGVAVGGAAALHLSTRSRTRRFVAGRSALSAGEFGALFTTQAEAALAPAIRDALRAYIPIDQALVRPDDKLCEELQLAVVDGLDANAFVAEVERLVGVRIPDEDARTMLTLRDIVSYVAERKSAGRPIRRAGSSKSRNSRSGHIDP